MSENGSKGAGNGAERESGALDPTAEDATTGNGTAKDAAATDATGPGSGGTGAVEKVGESRPGAGKHELASSQSRTGVLWTALAVAGVVLVFLLIFVAQNFMSVTVHFLGLQFSLPLGLALLFAAIVGGVLVWLAGTARMIQMRRAAKKARKQS
ncbi:LapA family protein [Saccharopolyspora mangrovi]|uniref:Lipopolysaccharide assembly protein LapA domain-containing protein n=1 Tax=Saccharopolyspora mangrovi TaxID=3082379 RepID=A0ABU6AIE0_9PSEU|nr:lipopolysaccharide assembly protein LapA domain-containing protein [Saccharopolyspora sp. S2-29]MEB3371218.1 lipopolysaccharide assembly protein LapA domain-containing protein [Saccharopolyspora sp. S2-29]